MMNPGYTAEIKATLTKYAEFYTKKDASGIVSLYLPDGDIVAIAAGKVQRNTGPAGILKTYEKEFSCYKEIASFDYKTLSIASLGHVGWISADIFANCILANGSHSIITGRFTAVLRKTGGKWLFVQSHFSIPAEGPAIYRK